MKFIRYTFIFTCIWLALSCSSNNNSSDDQDLQNDEIYFPPINSDTWETKSITDLNWNENQLQPLLDFVEDKGTKAFIILKNGRMAVEWYGNGSDAASNLQWNSAAKTLVAFTVGIAQDEGFLDLDDSSKDYLGYNWSLMTAGQEENVTIRHHLTMTSGLDYNLFNTSCTDQDCLEYLNEPDTFWYYHNALYTLSHDIVASAVGNTFNSYFNSKLKNKIGMQGAWVPIGYFKLYYSSARSMARFGLLNLNGGVWDGTLILNDASYFNEMTNTSQTLNRSYGYLWWLNGKSSFRLPESTEEFSGSMVPNAPADMYAGLGRDDQKMYVVPSEYLVVVRMGDNAGASSLLGPSSFDNELWAKISALMN